MKILLTGAAGFIGHHTAIALLKQGHEVFGLDSISDYYELKLKYGRLQEQGIINPDKIVYGEIYKSTLFENYRFVQLQLEDQSSMDHLFNNENIERVCHLAAQAGVRYSLTHPRSYIDSNVMGTLNILELCRHNSIEHLVYASSSSVYGLNKKQPFSEHHGTNHPVSLYAATKKSNEMMAHSYSHLFGLPVTGLRFFTVYGPWGRPDMAPMLFARAIDKGEPIKVFNYGEMSRDFTYVGDIVQGIILALMNPPGKSETWDAENPDPAFSSAPYKIYNIGNSKPIGLMDFIQTMERVMGKKAQLDMQPMQPGDVISTWADVSDLTMDLGYEPKIDLEEGIGEFVKWFNKYENGVNHA
ncbi:MAG: NAD-dependent epimerase [Spirochaetaceae bacterium]|jgi:UDP-glucuronate 4-epimerase|nr:NAD-dependent epimerase [Spirochaetaceae bacterium]